ncbi:MAG TPA: amidohydrolase [Bacillota bacterium]|jgi:amidohydrolase
MTPENARLISVREIIEAVHNLKSTTIAWRRDIHEHPELGLEEQRTSALVAEHLHRLGLEVRPGFAARTAVMGLLRGAQPGPTIALRSDMDALTIQEQNQVPYSSKTAGQMHACGHDSHVAMLLTAATVLSGFRDRLAGNVKFFFQPAEEGPGGALPMIEAGAMGDPKVDAVIGLHVASELETGQIGVVPGGDSASTDSVAIRVVGRGGHAAHPNEGVDAIAVAAEIVTALQTIVSREVAPLRPAVVTIGTIHGGTRSNILAGEVDLTGTFRTLDEATRDQVQAAIKRVVTEVAGAMRATVEIEFDRGYPAFSSDPGMYHLVKQAAADIVGPERVHDLEPTMGGEDFAYFCQRAPGTMFRVGSRNEAKGFTNPLHHPRFDLDEDALPVGVAVLVRSAAAFLNGGTS